MTTGVLERSDTGWAPAHNLLSGLYLTTTMAAAAFELSNLPGVAVLSPLIIPIASCSVCSRP